MKRVDELGISPWPWYKRVRFDVNELVGTDEYGHTQIVLAWTNDVINKKTPNNARLIAAAPDMYNALQFVFDHIAFQCFDGKNEVIEKAKELVRTALEKASGEEVYIG